MRSALVVALVLTSGCDKPGNKPSTADSGSSIRTNTPDAEAKLQPDGDLDGDGLANGSETEGWTISIQTADGRTEEKTVTSDPREPDTNGDGIGDKECRDRRLDPRALNGDTDGDGLSDKEELEVWQSSPNKVDTDRDSDGISELFDGIEARNGTSPAMDDTDGDSLNDRIETLERERFDPRIADTPKLEVQIGSMTLASGLVNSRTNQSVEGTEVQVERAETTENSTSDTSTHEVSAEVGVSASVEAEAGFPSGASVKASASVSASAGYAYTTAGSVTESAASESREAHARSVQEMRSESVTEGTGSIRVEVQLRTAASSASAWRTSCSWRCAASAARDLDSSRLAR